MAGNRWVGPTTSGTRPGTRVTTGHHVPSVDRATAPADAGPVEHDRQRFGRVEHEQLRGRALPGDTGGWRLGLAVLQHRGVSAWLRCWRDLPNRPAPADRHPVSPVADGDQLVAGLATMALRAFPGADQR